MRNHSKAKIKYSLLDTQTRPEHRPRPWAPKITVTVRLESPDHLGVRTRERIGSD